MRITLLIYLLFNIFYLGKAQHKLIGLQDKLVGLTPDTSIIKRSAQEVTSINKFWEIFKKVRDTEIEFEHFKGNVKFGFIGDKSAEVESTRANGGIKISKGSYPQEFEFSTDLNIQIDNGKLKENISNINITYDRFFENPKNPLLLEGFAFLNRRGDQLLGVQQRYEIGGGLILAYWHPKLYKSAKKKYDFYKKDRLPLSSETDKIIVCEPEEICVPIELKNIKKNDFDEINKSRQRIVNSIIKQNTPLRLGLLAGIFLEVENIVISDSLLIRNEKRFFQNDFDSSIKVRWEIRPTLDFRLSNNVFFKIRPYIKMPLGSSWRVNVEGKDVADIRIDFPIIVNIKASDKLSVNFNYTLFYDNAPNSTLIDNMQPNNIFLTANKKHEFYNFSVGYQF